MANPYRTLTTKQRILNYLGSRAAVSGTELESQASDWQTKSSVISRRARELANEGKIIRSIINKTVQYKLPSRTLSTAQAAAYLETIRLEEVNQRQGALSL